MFIGFQHNEILVSTSGAVITDGTDFPEHVGNGTTLAGFPQTDLMNAIDTAGGLSQIRMEIKMTGTQFGVKPPGTPMPSDKGKNGDVMRYYVSRTWATHPVNDSTI